MYTGDHFDKCRLPGAVFAHQRMNLALLKLELHVIQCLYAREYLSDPF